MSDLPIFTREADERIAELEAENARLKEALTKIASGDYDPEEVAENALALEASNE